jgi:DNA helicase IV
VDSAVPTPSPLDRELAIEQAHVDLVYKHLKKATKSARKVASEGQKIFLSNNQTWMREEDGTALFERDAFAFAAARRLAELDAEHEGLVFGRLDHTDSEIRYIGRIGVRDEEYEPLVIDWRARAAEPFYRATASAPMDVVRRRVLRCRNDVVVGIEDDLLDSSAAPPDLPVIGEGALMAALKRARGPRMRDIVATIQGEQDEAIRADYRGVTVISGGPGTGKTVVALHRAAYLLYSNRRRFERGGILVIGPSGLFMNYIERVLPSLGEDSVTLRSIGGVAVDSLNLIASRIDDAAAAAIKGSLRMESLLKRLVNLPLEGSGQQPLIVTIKGEALRLNPDALARIRREVLVRNKVNAGREAAQGAVLRELYAKLSEEVDLEFEVVSELITDQAAYQRFLRDWWPDLDPGDVLRRLASPAVVAQVSPGLLSAEEQAALAASFIPEDWSVADAALLDELLEIIGPVVVDEPEDPLLFLPDGSEMSELVTTADLLSHRRELDPDDEPYDTFAHVLVDEAQDISPMQWRMLRRRGADASWTIVGDPAQSSWPDVAEAERSLENLIGRAPSRRYRLSTNYRSPAEVFALAAQVVGRHFPDADLPHAVRATGIEPILLTTASDHLGDRLEQVLSELAGQVEGSIGVIAAPSRLRTLVDANLPIARANPERITFISPLNAKGLEYDAVVVVSPDQIVAESPGGERVLYVALTRPTQRLVTIDLDGEGAWRP